MIATPGLLGGLILVEQLNYNILAQQGEYIRSKPTSTVEGYNCRISIRTRTQVLVEKPDLSPDRSRR